MKVRTRFAPSPTGRLHLGNVRIAAFNWLFARRYGGSFILRVEDTDVERNVAGAETALMEDLRWLGLEWDEGPDVGGAYGPYRQSERSELYLEAAKALVEEDLAYPCYCTDEELARSVRRVSGGDVAFYDGRCGRLTPSERKRMEEEGRRAAIRFRLPPGDVIEIVDEVRGAIRFPSNDFDDFILLRRDGRPTYNFAVVADDAGMEITHVIRGVGHLSNTPRQALLFDAFGRERPRFAHLPTVLAPGGGRLSKRTGAASLDDLRASGYHPDGVLNYLSLLGWSSPDEREVLTREELVERIGLDRVGTSDTIYDPEKLRWVSGQHLQGLSLDALADLASPFVDRKRFPLSGEGFLWALEALRSRLDTLADLAPNLETYFFPEEGPELDAVRREIANDPVARRVVEAVAMAVTELDDWSADRLRETVRGVGRALSARGPALFHPIRKALTGVESGPDLGLVMAAQGRREVRRRLDRTMASGNPPRSSEAL